jgi:aryl-alcohol dehydrogenase-like predicted oxidoreductase
MAISQRELGRSGLFAAPLSLGGNVFGWTADEACSFEVLDAFVDGGGSLIDTADKYSSWVPGHVGGESETIIGKWLRRTGRRNRVLIATKAGMNLGGDRKGLSRRHLMRSVDESLARLGVDCIDLYQAHQDDPVTPIEETLGAYADLIRAGKIRAIGASNYSADRLAQALDTADRLGLPRFQTLQPEYNLVRRAGFESELQQLCVRESVSVIPYYALASGFLTGKYRQPSDGAGTARGGRASSYLDTRGLRILAALDSVAARFRSCPTAVAIAWLRDRPSIAAPIASATSVAQLADLIAGMNLELDPESVRELEEASQ